MHEPGRAGTRSIWAELAEIGLGSFAMLRCEKDETGSAGCLERGTALPHSDRRPATRIRPRWLTSAAAFFGSRFARNGFQPRVRAQASLQTMAGSASQQRFPSTAHFARTARTNWPTGWLHGCGKKHASLSQWCGKCCTFVFLHFPFSMTQRAVVQNTSICPL